MNDPLISVIVPIYNTEEYLKRCIESICNQTYGNLEIILVDDGSSDNSGAICDEYARNDSRIKVIHKENGGVSAARNTGLDAASGDYIGFVDSDDYIEETMYEELVHAAMKYNADISLCSINYADASGNLISDTAEDELSDVSFQTNRELLTSLVCAPDTKYVVLWNKLFKKDLLENVRCPLEKINEDSYIIHHVYLACTKAVLLNKRLYNYVLRPNSIMRTKKSLMHLDIIEVLIERIKFLEKSELNSLVNRVVIQAADLLADLYIEITPKTYEVKKRVRELYNELLEYVKLTEKKEFTTAEKYKLKLFEFFPLYVLLKKLKRFKNKVGS